MGSMYTAFGGFMDLPNLMYVKHKLRQDAANFTKFDSLIKIPWIIKPVFGYLSDNVFIFGYRMKIYLILCSALHVVLCLFVALKEPEFEVFTWCVTGMNFSISFIDTLSEGISSVVTKLELNIQKMEKIIKERTSRESGIKLEPEDNIAKEDHASMKAFGNFNAIRGVVSTLNNFLGGLIAEGLGIREVNLISCIYPLLFSLFCFLGFNEQRVIIYELTNFFAEISFFVIHK